MKMLANARDVQYQSLMKLFLAELEEKMTRLGRRTRAIEIAYQHLPAVATAEKKARNREFLVIGWDESAAILRRHATEQPQRVAAEQKGLA